MKENIFCHECLEDPLICEYLYHKYLNDDDDEMRSKSSDILEQLND